MKNPEYCLTCICGTRKGSLWPIEEGHAFLIGRINEKADINMSNEGIEKNVSRENTYFRIDSETKEIYVGTAANCKYGTVLNGNLLPNRLNNRTYALDPLEERYGWYKLSSGDEISVGKESMGYITFRVTCPALKPETVHRILSEGRAAGMEIQFSSQDFNSCMADLSGKKHREFTLNNLKSVKGLSPFEHDFNEEIERILLKNPITNDVGVFRTDLLKKPSGLKNMEESTIPVRKKTVKEMELDFSKVEPKKEPKEVELDYSGKELKKAPKDYSGIRLTDRRKIAEGGFSNIYLVKDAADNEELIVKSLDMVSGMSKMKKEQVLREAEIGKRLNHPNLVKTHAIFEDNRGYNILMEYCDQGSVEDLLQEYSHGIGLEPATDIILQALDALDYMHNVVTEQMDADGEVHEVTGIVHRDLKPSNLLLKNEGGRKVVKITDFGLAKAYELAGLSGITGNGAYGTPEYISCRQFLDYLYSGPSVDVYSIAATYYKLLTGKSVRPFEKCSRRTDQEKLIIEHIKTPIRKHNSDIPEKLAELIDSVLEEEKLPADAEFTTAAQFRRKIKEALDMN